MNSITRLGSIFYYKIAYPLYENSFGLLKQKKKVKIKYQIQRNKQNVVIFGVPNHGNLGDYAIFTAERELLRNYFPDANIFGVNMVDFFHEIRALKGLLTGKDLLILTGGGNLGNQYPDDERIRRKTIETFPENKIVLFPQTFFFTKDADGKEEEKITAYIYNRHKHLFLMARDSLSYEKMKKTFSVPVKLMPDVVLTCRFKEKENREGALLLLRRDVEKKLTDKEETALEKDLQKKFRTVTRTDTEISYWDYIKNPEARLKEKIEEVQRAELVVTDRLHGMVFAAAAATPCVVFGNYNHKVKETYKWVSHLPYVAFAEDESELAAAVQKVLGVRHPVYDNTEIMRLYDETIREILYG